MIKSKFLAGSIASVVTVSAVVAIWYFFDIRFSSFFRTNFPGILIMMSLSLIIGMWMGIFILLKPDGLTSQDKIDVEDKDSDLQ